VGNPAVHHPDHPTPPPIPSGNGILARVGGDYVARGNKQLPTAGPGLLEARRRVTVTGVPDLGDVAITYELKSHKHGRSRHWFWVAVFAEPLK
jgi:hypothetical protein